MLRGGAVGAASAALYACSGSTAAPAAAPPGNRLDIWAVNPDGLTVPSDRWTIVPWPKVVLNTTDVHTAADKATWLFPAGPDAIYTILANVAWDNALSPGGKKIRPRTHRKLMRIMQQGTGTRQLKQVAYSGAASEAVYHADLALLGDQELLSDGTKGYQQQQVTVQAGIPPKGAVTRIWVEVYQNSGMSLRCAWDGSNAPGTATRPPVVGLLAPSLMIGKLAPF